jgi:hypothetical protein
MSDVVDEDDEDMFYDEFPEEIVLFHYLANIYTGMTWKSFWYETPISVLKVLPKYLQKLWTRGWLGHNEMMYFKAGARLKGFKGFEDYGTGKVMRDVDDLDDYDDDLGIGDDVDDNEGVVDDPYITYEDDEDGDWDEAKGKPVTYQIPEAD